MQSRWNGKIGAFLNLLGYFLVLWGITRGFAGVLSGLFYNDAFRAGLICLWLGAFIPGTRFGVGSLIFNLKPILERASSLIVFYLFWSTAWGVVAVLRHYGFHSDDFDVGIFSQVLMNLSRGNGYYQLVDVSSSYFRIHQNYTLPILAPLFWTPYGTEVLLVIQSFLLFLPGLVLGIASKKHFKDHAWVWSWVVMFGFVCSIPVTRNTFFEFHETAFTLGLTTLWAYAFFIKNTKLFIVSGLLAGLTKENLLIGLSPGFLLYAIHLHGLSTSKIRAYLPWVILVAINFIIFGTQQKYFSDLNYAIQRYSNVSTSWNGIILHTLQNPSAIFQVLTNPYKRQFLVDLLFFNGFAPIFSGLLTLCWIPLFLTHTITNHWPQFVLDYHYVLEIWGALFVAGFATWQRVSNRYPKYSLHLAGVFFSFIFWPQLENLPFRFQQFGNDAKTNEPFRNDFRNYLDAFSKQCEGKLVGIADYRIFAQVYDKGTVYPYRDLTQLSKKDKFQEKLLENRRCRFILAKSYQIDEIIRSIPGPFNKVAHWWIFDRDDYYLYISVPNISQSTNSKE
jgi:uncharacterized membrane protein